MFSTTRRWMLPDWLRGMTVRARAQVRPHAEKNAISLADGPWHAPGWPIARVTASLQSMTAP